jgi:glycosyltransferase involved in cell wall biosynthesis
MAWTPPKSLFKDAAASRPQALTGPPVAGVCVQNAMPPNFMTRTFMLFAPWCDQGLGNQARAYCAWLRELGHEVVVFACRPSKKSSAHAPSRMQADPSEWAGVRVHHSDYVREAVPHEEVVQLATSSQVTDALMLETCHPHIYLLSAALSIAKIRVYAIPNIEMVRRSELDNLRKLKFHRVLCSNNYTYDVLKFFKVPVPKLELFPFALKDDAAAPTSRPHQMGEPVRFLLVGGMNAECRKQATRVMGGFAAAFGRAGRVPRATLTILCQGADSPRERGVPPGVTVVRRHLTNAEVLQHYADHHVVVMLSRAEGIGLCLHEAMRAGCAVLSMDTAMYKEMVLAGRTGWLIPSKVEDGTAGARMIGNTDPVVHTHTFDPRALATVFKLIVEGGGGTVPAMQAGARRAFDLLYSAERVTRAYTEALSIEEAAAGSE